MKKKDVRAVRSVSDVLSIEEGSVWGDAQGRLYLVREFLSSEETPEEFDAVCTVCTDKGSRLVRFALQAFLSHGFMIPLWAPSQKGQPDSEGGQMIREAILEGEEALAIDVFRRGFIEAYGEERMGSWTLFYHLINRKAPVNGPASRAMYRDAKRKSRKRKTA